MGYFNTTSGMVDTYPASGNAVSITRPTNGAWDNSPWGVLLPGLDVTIRLLWVAVFVPLGNGFEYEFDFATGPDTSPTIFATFPASSIFGGGWNNVLTFWQPRDFDPFTAIYARWRTAATSPSNMFVNLDPCWVQLQPATQFPRRSHSRRRYPV
jgi:hypothetical protein